jgi:hypothetical protein
MCIETSPFIRGCEGVAVALLKLMNNDEKKSHGYQTLFKLGSLFIMNNDASKNSVL